MATQMYLTPASPPTNLRIISLNCWGLKYISTHRSARLIRIGEELAQASPQPDVVVLQECWTQADYLSILNSVKPLLPHAKYYHSGIFGGGLAIFSRFPIMESSMYRYPLNGRPTAFFRGDWFVGKGVACATLRLGPSEDDVLEVLNTHLHAPYEREPHDSYICHRTAQAWEIAKIAREKQRGGRTVIACGDFNMVPGSFAHAVVESRGGVRDVWMDLWPRSSVGAAEDEVEKARQRELGKSGEIPSIETNLGVNGTTCDSLANTWRMPKEYQKRIQKREPNVGFDAATPDRRGKRLDYIFLGTDEVQRAKKWSVQDVRVGMTMRHPTLHCSLSDHFSIEATLTRLPAKTDSETRLSPTDHDGVATLRYLSPSILDQILLLVQKYFLREYRQRRLRLAHFGLSIFVSIGCFIAVWWSPHNYVSFILILLSTLGLGSGIIDGLIGGLFVGSELRALKEFHWEVENAKGMAERENKTGS